MGRNLHVKTARKRTGEQKLKEFRL
ncbi:hypothetical protein A2U01_0076046, partial [Trifolium medium]|nr:hypothetical protein [Trifolium medium]